VSSPALAAQSARSQAVGRVLAPVDRIGFGISIRGVQLFVTLAEHLGLAALRRALGLGPLRGVRARRPLRRRP
jgi:hypothetical protein